MFKKVDDLLIDRVFQPFAWWFQARTGKDNFWLTDMFTISSFVVPFLYLVTTFIGEETVGLAVVQSALLILLVVSLYQSSWLIRFMGRARKRFFEKEKGKFGNNLTEREDYTVRLALMVIFSGVSVITIINHSSGGSIWGFTLLVIAPLFGFQVAANYLTACTPLPKPEET